MNAEAIARRQYGDQMAKEGETSHIPDMILFMYGCIALLSVACWYFSGEPWWTIPVYYLATMVAFYAWHWLAHQKFMGIMNELHMDHHIESYPANDFYGDKERMIFKHFGKDCPTLLDLCNPGGTIVGNFWHEGPLYVFFVGIVIAGRVYLGTNNIAFCFIFAGVIAMGVLGNAFHMSFHVRNFELEKYQWYMELRTLHYIHHLGDMQSNLAMVNLGFDGIFSSLQVDDPLRRHKDKGNSMLKGMMKKSVVEEALENEQTLPDGVTPDLVDKIRNAAGVQAMTLGLDISLDIKTAKRGAAINRGYPTVLLRMILLFAGLKLWFSSEGWLWETMQAHGAGEPIKVELSDAGQTFFKPFGDYLAETKQITKACTLSQLSSELITLIICIWSIFGKTFRPVLACIFGLSSRLLLRLLTQMPMCSGSLWNVPADLPRVFAQTETANIFFSPRVLVATVFLCECIYRSVNAAGKPLELKNIVKHLLAVFSILVFVFNISLTLALHATWSFDIVIAIFVARLSTIFAYRFSPFIDLIMP